MRYILMGRKEDGFIVIGRASEAVAAEVEKKSLPNCSLHGLVLPEGQNSKIGQH
jgi:hypothetical protein